MSIFMSNDARKIYRFLDTKFANREIELNEVISMEQAILAYYPNPIISMMDGLLKKAKPEKLANYSNFSYHLPALRRITSKRSETPAILIGWNEFNLVYDLLQRRLFVVDYNHDTLLLIIDIAHGCEEGKWDYNNISKAITISIANGARSVQYVMAVLQKAYAEKQAVVQREIAITDSAQSANVHKDSSVPFVVRMSIEAMWAERKENNDIEKKLRGIWGE